MTDPISDMLTRIRNAALIGKPEVLVPMSKIKHEIAKLLKKEGLILDEEIVKTKSRKNKASQFDEIRLLLKYKKSGRSAITSLKRISKPGRRIYVSRDQIPYVLNDLGLAILSTSRGLMTNKQARRAKIGGEIMFEIW